MWCSLVPQEYKAQGGSPVKLKPFKYDSRPGPAEPVFVFLKRGFCKQEDKQYIELTLVAL